MHVNNDIKALEILKYTFVLAKSPSMLDVFALNLQYILILQEVGQDTKEKKVGHCPHVCQKWHLSFKIFGMYNLDVFALNLPYILILQEVGNDKTKETLV